MLYLLLWATYPTKAQSEELRQQLAEFMQEVPEMVNQSIVNLP